MAPLHLALLAPLLLPACAGAGGDSGGEAPGGSYPLDWSAEGIAAFIEAGSWQQAPWQAETEEPREPSSVSSPHDRVRVFLNDVVLASSAAGNGAYGGTAHETGSMAVKVLHDDEDAVLGHAAMLKLDGDFGEWVYWCQGPPGRCGSGNDDEQTWGVGLETDCGYCHGGVVFNASPGAD